MKPSKHLGALKLLNHTWKGDEAKQVYPLQYGITSPELDLNCFSFRLATYIGMIIPYIKAYNSETAVGASTFAGVTFTRIRQETILALEIT